MNNPYQTCPQCGTQLAPGQTFCNNCGKRIEPTGVDPTQRASGYSSPSNPGYGQPVQPTQYAGPPSTPPTQYSSDPYGTPQYGNTSYGAGAGAPPPPPPDAGYQMPPVTPSYPSPTYPPSIGGPQFPQQPAPKKGPNVGLIVGGIILAIVVVCGGSFWAFSSLVKGGGSATQTTPTTTASTPTVAVTPTPKALFTDNFTDNHNNWDVSSGQGYNRSISGGIFKMVEANHKLLLDEFPQSPPADATISVNFTLVSGDKNDSVGLLARANGSDYYYGYYIEIYGDDTYDIAAYYLDPVTKQGKNDFLMDTSSTGLKPKGQENQMSVTFKGSSITLVMNGQPVKTITDSNSRFSSGSTYLFAANGKSSSGVTATFSNVTVSPASA